MGPSGHTNDSGLNHRVSKAPAQQPKSTAKKRKLDDIAESDDDASENLCKDEDNEQGTSNTLEPPEMGPMDLRNASIYTANPEKSTSSEIALQTIQQAAPLSAAEEKEFKDYVKTANEALFGKDLLGGDLNKMPRYTLATSITAPPEKSYTSAHKNGLDSRGPPISSIDAIFNDIARKATEFGLRKAMPPFPLHVATMCSGTEAPLLGLSLIQQALVRQGEPSFSVLHRFSAEIEPSKQAYIERNFSPPILFADVTDFREDKEARTAYGGTAEPPKNVHIVVAGSSCVDYSTLNNNRKEFGAAGQSYDTLQGIRSYVNRARPNILIVENVKGAPWIKIEAFFDEIDYFSTHLLVDTKNFYLPQTRERGYLFALDKRQLKDVSLQKIVLARWEEYMQKFQKRANAPFLDFIYGDNDTELHEAKLEYDSLDIPTKAGEWAGGRARHAKFRIENQYGNLRPMTHWQDNGSCRFPDFAWMKWSKSQRQRVWDTLDIEHIRHAGDRNYDMNYKPRWIELSQHVDRDFDTRQWGIVPCLTPTGMPYLTTRGGPVSGAESLLLQGIPKYALDLTKETSRQLQNLAGNAMSVPVVTSAMLSAILAVQDTMEAKSGGDAYLQNFSESDTSMSGTAFPALPAVSTSTPTSTLRQVENLEGTELIQLGSIEDWSKTDVLHAASTSLRFCKCEGSSGRKHGPFQICKDCGHMTCHKCGQNPTHNYRDIPKSITECRRSSAIFQNMITEALPRILQLNFTNGEELADLLVPMPMHQSCKDQYQLAAKLAFHSTVVFKHVQRGEFWKIVFEGTFSRLELRFIRKCRPSASVQDEFFGSDAVECHWLLFATGLAIQRKGQESGSADGEADAGDIVREALQYPIARMIPQQTLLIGKWETLRYNRVPLDIRPANQDREPVWEAGLGLERSVFKDARRATVLQVDPVTTDSSSAQVAGRYVLRAKCGTASASLYVRQQGTSHKNSPMFLFLEPKPLKNDCFDPYVFSTTNYRRAHEEFRMTLAEVSDENCPLALRSTPEALNASLGSDAAKSQSTPATSFHATFQDWVGSDGFHLGLPEAMESQHIFRPLSFDEMVLGSATCDYAPTFMLIELPIENYAQTDWKPGCRFPIQLTGKQAALEKLRWLLERVGSQMVVHIGKSPHIHTVPYLYCEKCVPTPPSVVYKNFEGKKKKPKESGENGDSKAAKTTIKAMEDKREATVFEHAIKQRPAPIEAMVHCHEHIATLEVKLNITALAHQVLAQLGPPPQDSVSQQPTIEWFLVGDNGRQNAAKFKVKPFLSSENELECAQPKHFARQLWPEQSRVLTWMMRQELKAPEWYEKEREEVSIPALGCRIEVEARMPKKVRGGVLADDVGGGKTTTSLALVVKMLEHGYSEPMGKELESIPIEATLILVPYSLLKQWTEEMDACFGKRHGIRRHVIRNVKALLKMDVPALRKNDIILTSWSIFDGGSEEYWSALEELCSAHNRPPKAGRAFSQWLKIALDELASLTKQSGGDCAHPVWGQPGKPTNAYDSFADFGKRCPERRTSFKPLLHAFTWRRIIVDEYSYLNGYSFLAVLTLKRKAIWLLSGTPPVSNFDAVNTTAKLLHTKVASEDDQHGYHDFLARGSRPNVDKTDAEQFQWYRTKRSPAWLQVRNKLADDFLAKFVRKNPSEAAKDIKKLSHHTITFLSPLEQIIYFEVLQRLMCQNFKFGSKSEKKPIDMTHQEAVDMVIYTSEHPEDALLSCCSEWRTVFKDLKDMTQAENMCVYVGNEARKALGNLYCELYEILRAALHCYGQRSTGDQHDNTSQEKPELGAHMLSFIIRIGRNNVGDKLLAELIDKIIMAASKNTQAPSELYQPRETKKFGRQKNKQAEGTHDEVADDIDGPQDLASSGLSAGVLQQKARAEGLGMIVLEMLDQFRQFRLFKNLWNIFRGKQLLPCSGCKENGQPLSELLLLGTCGHVACQQCLNSEEMRKHNLKGCLDKDCNATALKHNLIMASRFSPEQMSDATEHGSKMDAIVDQVKAIFKSSNDSILIFVQFPRVLEALLRALRDHAITYLDATKDNKTSEKRVAAFREGGPKDRVLILQLDSVNAAGWNLQRANHIMFVSAYFSPSKFEYVATMTQAVGRAHRFGQRKTVHVYHFLMAKTIEVNMIEERENKTLAQQPDGTFRLEERINDLPTEWEGPDMQGSASGMGSLEGGEFVDELDIDEAGARKREAQAEQAHMNAINALGETYLHNAAACTVCCRSAVQASAQASTAPS